jgi:curved DNA-binding protein CbpA
VTTPFKVLGISVEADEETIRSAFRKAAKRYHPDLNPGDSAAERRLRRLISARDVLLDPVRRSSYVEKERRRQVRWQAPLKASSARIAGSALVVVSLLLFNQYSSPTASVAANNWPASVASADIPDPYSAELKVMRDLRETLDAPPSANGDTDLGRSKRILRSSTSSPHNVPTRRPNRFQDVAAKAATTWRSFSSKLRALQRSGT